MQLIKLANVYVKRYGSNWSVVKVDVVVVDHYLLPTHMMIAESLFILSMIERVLTLESGPSLVEMLWVLKITFALFLFLMKG